MALQDLELETCLLSRFGSRLFIIVHFFISESVIVIAVTDRMMVVDMARVDALLVFALRTDMLVTFQLTVPVFERETHRSRSRLLAMALLLCERDVWEEEVYVHSTQLQVVAMIQRYSFTLGIKVSLMMQTIVTQDMDTEVTRVKVKKDLGMLP